MSIIKLLDALIVVNMNSLRFISIIVLFGILCSRRIANYDAVGLVIWGYYLFAVVCLCHDLYVVGEYMLWDWYNVYDLNANILSGGIGVVYAICTWFIY